MWRGMGQAELDTLIASGQIERVLPDPDTAREDLAMARNHIKAALMIADVDPTLAFTGLYDAIRKSIQAHMRTNGYRTTRGLGAHIKIGAYAEAALDELGIGEHLEEFEQLRITRNQSEYSGIFATGEDVAAASGHAVAIVEAIAGAL